MQTIDWTSAATIVAICALVLGVWKFRVEQKAKKPRLTVDMVATWHEHFGVVGHLPPSPPIVDVRAVNDGTVAVYLSKIVFTVKGYPQIKQFPCDGENRPPYHLEPGATWEAGFGTRLLVDVLPTTNTKVTARIYDTNGRVYRSASTVLEPANFQSRNPN